MTIGSKPSVFQTAPPQPASKARRTWYSEFVGGAEASQNGFGAFTPQNSTREVGHVSIGSRSQDRMVAENRLSMPSEVKIDTPARQLAVLDRVNDLAPLAEAIAAGEEAGDGGRAGGRVDDDPAPSCSRPGRASSNSMIGTGRAP